MQKASLSKPMNQADARDLEEEVLLFLLLSQLHRRFASDGERLSIQNPSFLSKIGAWSSRLVPRQEIEDPGIIH